MYGPFRGLMIRTYELLVETPLRKLYMHGPFLGGYGFWSGKESVDICSEMTGIPSNVWVVNRADCQDRIDRGFYSLLVSANFALYVYLVWLGINSCASYVRRCRHRRRQDHKNRDIVYVMVAQDQQGHSKIPFTTQKEVELLRDDDGDDEIAPSVDDNV